MSASPTERPAPSGVGAAASGGWLAGGWIGLAVGCFLALFNPVVGVAPRLLLVFVVWLLYQLLLGVPAALAWGALAGAAARSGRTLGARPMGPLVFLVSVSAVVLLGAVRTLGKPADGEAWGPPIGGLGFLTALLLATLPVAAWWWRRTSRGPLELAAGGVALALLVSLLPPLRDDWEPEEARVGVEVEELQARPPSHRVAIVGFDGLDPEVVSTLIEAGHMPTFERVRDEGLFAPLRVLPAGYSPPTWTTLGTGVGPQRHGVFDFVKKPLLGTGLDLAALTAYPDGLATVRLMEGLARLGLVKESLVRPADRQVAALWNLTSAAQIDTCIVNWMFTWPAEDVLGTTLSDRAFFAHNLGAVAVERAPGQGVPLRLVGSSEEAGDRGSGLCTPTPNCLADMPLERESEGIDAAAEYEFHMAEDAFYVEAAERALEGRACQLSMVYSHLPDFLNHTTEPAVLEGVLRGELEAGANERFVEVYGEVDRTLARLLEVLGPDVDVLVVSDHGVTVRDIGGRAKVTHGYPGPDGILLVRQRAGAVRPVLDVEPSVYDIVPTALGLLGLPRVSNMPGRALLNEEPLRVLPVGRVPDFATAADAQEQPEMTEEVLERLKSLGYLQ